jgi:hypothetical protein
MSARARLLLDLAMFGVLLVAYNPAWSGLAWHEWLSVAVVVPLLLHLVVNWNKVLRVVSTFTDRLFHGSRLDLVVDTVLFVVAVLVMVSGLMISQVVARAVGITIAPASIWVSVHSWSADLTIVLLLVHFVLHWRWVYNVSLRLMGRRGTARRPVGGPEDHALAGLRAENRRLGRAAGLEPAREPTRARTSFQTRDARP